MRESRRGFGKERNSALKVGLAAIALVGFAVGWAGFARSQPERALEPGPSASPAPSSSAAGSPTGTPPRSATVARRSRGS